MTTFDEREKAAEAAFAHEQDLMFRAHARRDKKLGLWAGKLMGLNADEAAAYVDQLLEAQTGAGGEAGILAKVVRDLRAAKITQSEPQVRAKMNEFLAAAMVEFKAGR